MSEQEQLKEEQKVEDPLLKKIQEDMNQNLEFCFVDDIKTNIKIISNKEQYCEAEINKNSNCFVIDTIQDDESQIIGLILVTKRNQCFLILKPDFECTEFEHIKKILQNDKATFLCDDKSAENLFQKTNLNIEPNYVIFQIPDGFDDIEKFLKEQKVDLHVIKDIFDAEDDYIFLTTNVAFHCQDAVFAFNASEKSKQLQLAQQRINDEKSKALLQENNIQLLQQQSQEITTELNNLQEAQQPQNYQNDDHTKQLIAMQQQQKTQTSKLTTTQEQVNMLQKQLQDEKQQREQDKQNYNTQIQKVNQQNQAIQQQMQQMNLEIKQQLQQMMQEMSTKMNSISQQIQNNQAIQSKTNDTINITFQEMRMKQGNINCIVNKLQNLLQKVGDNE